MPEPLRIEQLEALLQQLGPDRDFAGVQYEQLRRRLVTVFAYRRCPEPEKLADDTLDRVARRLEELGDKFEGSDPARYVFGVAWNVAREAFRRPAMTSLSESWQASSSAPVRGNDEERDHACLDTCLARLDAVERDLVLGYHEGQRSARIRMRAELADRLGLSANALRLKIHRITCRLRECVLGCIAGEGATVDA